MASSCCEVPGQTPSDALYRKALWAVLIVNAVMFGVELTGGLMAGSVSLQADALDFLGDSATYAITLLVLGMGAVWRSRAGLAKGLSLIAFGLWVMTMSVLHALHPEPPQAPVMGAIGVLALAANVFCALVLYRFRAGDSNMRSVWLCSRNDAIANIAVIAAAGGVWASGTPWPDLAVGVLIAAIGLSAGFDVVRQARGELRVPVVGSSA